MFEIFGIKDTAFQITPPGDGDLVWFGFPKLKMILDKNIKRSLEEENHLCILNRGRFGAGKTFAARFYRQELPGRKSVGNYSNVFFVFVESPKQGNIAFKDLYSRILNEITFQVIKESSILCQEKFGPGDWTRKMQEATKNEDIAHVLSNMSESNFLMCKTYFFGTSTTKDLRALGAAKKLVSDNDFSSALAGIFFLLINATREKEKFNRLFLWIDEMEDLVTFQMRFYLPFTQALRSLMDRISSHFTVFFNFTFSEPEDLPAIENVLREAIMSRINEHIVFEKSDTNDIELYLKELFKHFRVGKREWKDISPFDTEGFRRFISLVVTLTPRDINKVCDSLFRKALEYPQKPNQERGIISSDLIEKEIPFLMKNLDVEQ